MRVVLDTNVIVSGLNFPGNERIVLDLARRGRFELCLSPFILEEVSGVLGRKFGWSEGRSTQAIQMLRDSATVIEPKRTPKVFTGVSSDKVLISDRKPYQVEALCLFSYCLSYAWRISIRRDDGTVPGRSRGK